MDLANKLLELRKKKGLSQEEVADRLGVSRQTVSKWETGVSTPDFDKIGPLCELYEISTNELLNINYEVPNHEKEDQTVRRKRALLLVIAVFMYITCVLPVILTDAGLDEIVGVVLMFIMVAVATCLLIYRSAMYAPFAKKPKIDIKKETKANAVYNVISKIMAILTVIVYLLISFATGAWYITWIIFLIFGLLKAIVKLLFVLNGEEVKDEDDED